MARRSNRRKSYTVKSLKQPLLMKPIQGFEKRGKEVEIIDYKKSKIEEECGLDFRPKSSSDSFDFYYCTTHGKVKGELTLNKELLMFVPSLYE